MNITKAKIANALESTASDHVVAESTGIYDQRLEKYQDEINSGFTDDINRIDEEIRNIDTNGTNGIFDISLYNKVGSIPSSYSGLTAALSEVPDNMRVGGVNVRYIDTNSNKYKQYRLTTSVWSTIPTDWQSLDALYETAQFVDCGNWIDGSSSAITPSVRNGIYLSNEINPNTSLVETDDVWKDGFKWRCAIHQPVTENATNTYYPPKWNTVYWDMIEGDDTIRVEFSSSNGYKFRVGQVSTVITPYVMMGSLDISEDIGEANYDWSRSTESGTTTADTTWTAQHQNQRILTLTNADMPVSWSYNNRAIFTLTVTVNDGRNSVIVQREIRFRM